MKWEREYQQLIYDSELMNRASKNMQLLLCLFAFTEIKITQWRLKNSTVNFEINGYKYEPLESDVGHLV
jgi:hypothetical protein